MSKCLGAIITLSSFNIFGIMFKYFADNNIDIAIIETGLGGRFDATNVISSNICSVITHIDLDHTDRLGDTKEKIAYEKAGIIKKDSIVITSEGYEAIKDKADEMGALFVLVQPYIPPEYAEALSLKGNQQYENLALVLAVLELKYKITVKNTGEIAGSAQATETIPEGLTMEENLNTGWEINGNKATLTTKTIEPKEKQEYEVVLTWNKQKFGTVKNTVQISNIKNEANFEDNNQEDNQAYVEFVIGIKTGLEENATMLVLGISLQIVAVIGMKYTKKKEQLY